MSLWNEGGSKAVRLRFVGLNTSPLSQEQRQLERCSTKRRPDLGDVLSFCFSQAGFRARQYLFKVCIATNMVMSCDRLSGKKIVLFFQVFQLTALILRGPIISGERLISNLERVMLFEDEFVVLCFACGFREESAFHPEKHLFCFWHRYVG